MQIFDVGILETKDYLNPMARIIKESTATWLTHAILFKDEHGNTWDARPGGILNGNISDYAGRRITILRYRWALEKVEALSWVNEQQAKCKGYDFKALIGFLMGNESWESEDCWYCSELPYWFLQRLGPLLTRVDKTFVYPEFIYSSPCYKKVAEFVIPGEIVKPIEFEFPYVGGAP